MDERFLKPYQPREHEEVIYHLWEQSGGFNPDRLAGERKENYVILMAPPNITGTLHMGHALENTVSDILIRFERMRGKKTLWLPGLDHAGIATQVVVEKELKKHGLTRQQLGREKFIAEIWRWKKQYGGKILEQLKTLGCSADWSRLRFTMDEDYQTAVRQAFEHYREKGLIYRGERVINWCVKDQTAISDLEIEYQEETTTLFYLKYPLKNSSNFITVATTRPETMLGDTAVAVNPEDKRWQKFTGQTAIVPLVNREVPVVFDEAVDPKFGSGAVKVTPAHDLPDYELALRHNLPRLKIINESGVIKNTGTDFDGKKIQAARAGVIEKLTALNLLEKQEPLKHHLAVCSRCGGTTEPLLSEQWFLKMKPLAESVIKGIENREVEYYPERFKKIVLAWLNNVRDWCISRQLWWGHPIPDSDEKQEVFDTWFSSALWPLAALGWPNPEAKDFKNFYPTTLLHSGRDIIHLWVSRMIISGLQFTGQAPFRKVLIHPTVLTKEGRRMSKSLGTGLDPQELIDEFGADAIRFGLVFQNLGGQDIHFSADHVRTGKKFANKLWNISRYVLGKNPLPHRSSLPNKLNDKINRAMTARLNEIKQQITELFENYRFGEAAHLLYNFLWHEVADKFIEQTKPKNDEETKAVLGVILLTSLKLLHPLMPFVTEAVWQKLPQRPGEQEILMTAPWPF